MRISGTPSRILIRKNLKHQTLEISDDGKGRRLWVKVSIDDICYGICGAYAPNISVDKLLYFQDLHQFLITKKNRHVNFILAGDLNTVMSNKLDKRVK